ncbi:hypothetical protein [Sulfitobacter sp.]|uniref:hypothetical protein n=1 Tax=Sulfitobacter sp. TaxID=1903071 RepID=UPI0030016860
MTCTTQSRLIDQECAVRDAMGVLADVTQHSTTALATACDTIERFSRNPNTLRKSTFVREIIKAEQPAP